MNAYYLGIGPWKQFVILKKFHSCLPIVSNSQKLSKIETLRLARNYIEWMTAVLGEGNRNEFAESAAFSAQAAAGYLSRGISQGTSNTITSLLGLKPRPIVSCNQGESLQPTGASPRSRMHSAFHLTDITAQLAVPQPSTSTDVGMRHESSAVHVPITNAMEWDPSWNTLLIDTWNSLPLIGDLPELPPF